MEIRTQLLAKRNHPDFLEKSRRNRENRNKRPSLHCQESMTTELKFKMTAKLDCELSAPEMFARSRIKNQTGVSDKGSTFVDERGELCCLVKGIYGGARDSRRE